MQTISLSSPAFQHKGLIPSRFTCDGDDVNPPLVISNVPAAAKSLCLIVDDPDAPAGTWVHWVVWNIGPDTGEIAENSVPAGAGEGLNDFHTSRYGGPCPPSGKHRYYFRLYALDTMISSPPGSTRSDIERAMKGHILSQAELVGLYART